LLAIFLYPLVANKTSRELLPPFLWLLFLRLPSPWTPLLMIFLSLLFPCKFNLGGFLAVLLRTFLPVLFLINLFISTETRKAGAEEALKGNDF
jgi:photosystem II reaction center protein PsbM